MASSSGQRPKRVTVYHGRYRADAMDRLRHIDPTLNPAVSGEPGKWKLRRDLCADENYEQVRYRSFG